MAKSKFFRVAVEGPTVDGRVIERQMLVEAADGYEPDTYTARINCEHIAGYSPDRPFNCYGTVRSLRTEEIELAVNGAKEKLLSLAPFRFPLIRVLSGAFRPCAKKPASSSSPMSARSPS